MICKYLDADETQISNTNPDFSPELQAQNSVSSLIPLADFTV
jgi:hypothetical protein